MNDEKRSCENCGNARCANRIVAIYYDECVSSNFQTYWTPKREAGICAGGCIRSYDDPREHCDGCEFNNRKEQEEMTGINEVAKEIHENAVEHGWWEEKRGFPEILALIHSEVSEALEEYRNGRAATEIYTGDGGKKC